MASAQAITKRQHALRQVQAIIVIYAGVKE